MTVIDHATNMTDEEKEEYHIAPSKSICNWCDQPFETRLHLRNDPAGKIPAGTPYRRTGKCLDCDSTLNQYARAFRQLVWVNMKSQLSCVYCGMTGRSDCMEFDHFDPKGMIDERNKKVKAVSYWVGGGSCKFNTNFFREVTRCITICANCHAEKTKHETLWEDSWYSGEQADGAIVGEKYSHGTRRNSPTTKEIMRANNLMKLSSFEEKLVNREAHLKNLKIIYKACYNFYMSLRRKDWKTNSDILAWEYIGTETGMVYDETYGTMVRQYKSIGTNNYVSRSNAGSQSSMRREDKEATDELLNFDCDARMGVS